MASTIYYGKSVTAPGEQVKEVIVQGLDSTVTQESDFLTSGDLLLVYFSNKNTHSTPYMKLYNGDIDNEIGASEDTGNLIKIQSTAADLSGIWSDGEVCAFVYVENSGIFYWYLTNAALAADGIYGKAKLTDSFNEGYDADASVTAGAVFDLVSQQRTGSLEYIPESEQDIQIGTLKLLDSDEEEISTVELYVPQIIDPENFRSQTSEIYNNGPKKEDGEETTDANIGAGYPYITHIVPNRLSFANLPDPEVSVRGLTIINGNNEFVAYELADAQNNSSINSQGNISINAAQNYKAIVGKNNKGTLEVNYKGLFKDSLRIQLNTTNDQNLITKITNLGWKSACIK